LTSKVYSFKYRAWDAMYFESIDITSSSLSPIRLYIKGTKISRVLPQYDESFEWAYLTEKARYIYDAFQIQRLVSPLVKTYKIINSQKNEFFISTSWNKLKKFFLYYNINNQFKQNKNIIILPILGYSCDIIFLNYLKHLFLKNGQNNFIYDENLKFNVIPNDFRFSYLNNLKNIYNIDVCILLNITLRLENPLLNAKIRQEYLWNNTKIFQFGAKYTSAYKYSQLTNNLYISYKIFNGQISNLISYCLKKKNILCITSILNKPTMPSQLLYKVKTLFNKKNINFNIYTNSTQIEQINLFELNILNKIHSTDNCNSLITYFINTNKIHPSLISKTSIYQSSHFNNSYNFINLFIPSTTFFETRTKLYINNLGLLRRVPKLVSFYKMDILDDLDSSYFVTLFIPFIKIKLKFNDNKISQSLYKNLPIKSYDCISNNILFTLTNYNNNYIFNINYYNMLYNTIYKNFYKTNNFEILSSTMTTLTNLFLNKISNYYNN